MKSEKEDGMHERGRRKVRKRARGRRRGTEGGRERERGVREPPTSFFYRNLAPRIINML